MYYVSYTLRDTDSQFGLEKSSRHYLIMYRKVPIGSFRLTLIPSSSPLNKKAPSFTLVKALKIAQKTAEVGTIEVGDFALDETTLYKTLRSRFTPYEASLRFRVQKDALCGILILLTANGMLDAFKLNNPADSKKINAFLMPTVANQSKMFKEGLFLDPAAVKIIKNTANPDSPFQLVFIENLAKTISMAFNRSNKSKQ